MKHKFSIIIPIYNSEKTIDKCIKSVLNQTYNDYEILLINDGSTDNSQKKCEGYLNNKNIKLISKPNGGVSSARNIGIKNAIGDYILFVDSDDVINENMLDEYNNVLDNNNIDLIISNVELIDKNGKKSTFYRKDIFDKIKNLKDFCDNFQDIYINGIANSIFSKCYKKSKIINFFDEKVSLGEDLIFNLNYLKNCDNIFMFNMNLYNYFIYSNSSLSSKYREDGFETLRYVYDMSKSIISEYRYSIINTLPLKKKYICDCLTMAERIARNKEKNIKNRIIIIKDNYIKFSPYISSEKIKMDYGIKWLIYDLLIRKKMYGLFTIFAILIERKNK